MHYISLSTYLLHLQKFCPIQKQQQQQKRLEIVGIW